MNWFPASFTVVALATALGAAPPGLRLSTSARRDSGSFLVLLDSSGGHSPAALQCDLVIPPVVTVSLSNIQLGSAGSAAGKALNCAAAKAAGPRVRYTCILAGGGKPIGNGPVLVVYYAPQKLSEGPPVRIAIEKALGVAANGTAMPVPDTEVILGR